MKIKIKYQINKRYFMTKKRDRILLQKENNGYIQFKDLVRNYDEIEKRNKTLEENFSEQDSENI